MKKGIQVLAIAVALSVLVSIITLFSSVAVAATKTNTTPKQSPAQNTPPASPIAKSKVAVHTKFWDLEFDYLEVKGVRIKSGMANATITVKPGDDVMFIVYYKIKTPLIKDITEADANYWGSGKGYNPFYHIVKIYNEPPNPTWQNAGTTGLYLPKFTWADVQHWKNAGLGNTPKIWPERAKTVWHVISDQHVRYAYFDQVYIDYIKAVPETNESNNEFNDPGHSLLKIVISPFGPKNMHLEKTKK